MGKKRTGRCHLCGRLGPLTTDHVIPAAAGNTGERWPTTFHSLSKNHRRGQQFQNGMVRDTLCARCNTMSGTHYDPAYTEWSRQMQAFHDPTSGDSSLALPFIIQPLAIAKRIALMALVMADAASIDEPAYRELRSFALFPERRARLRHSRMYAYNHYGPPAFATPVLALATKGGPCPNILTQVGIEPLGVFVTRSDAASGRWARRKGLLEVTDWATYAPRELPRVHLLMPKRVGALPFEPLRQEHLDGDSVAS